MSDDDKYLNEREWIPLWAAGPVVAVGMILGLVGLIKLVIVLWGLLP